MYEIDKKFDGVIWEWKGKIYIKDLKPICPKCKYELDIKMHGFGLKEKQTDDGRVSITIKHNQPIYFCSKCGFSSTTNESGIDEIKDLYKVAQKEFEHRIRLKTSRNTNR